MDEIQEGKFYKYKLDEYKFNLEMQKCIKDTCKYCIENTTGADELKKKHPVMMLGKIQSGKTRAFTGLIALAFDNEFDMVFILTKNSKALIEQTETRMKKEFRKFVDNHEVFVTNIMKSNSHIRGYQLENKNIVIAKKQKTNLTKLIDFIEKYSINAKKKCLIIDDEADTTGIGYSKVKDKDEFDLRTVASKVDDMRGTLDGCVFVQVTATPYALYLQPDFIENEDIKPIKPRRTVLVPSGEGYVGGDYYFNKSKKYDHPARFLFQPMGEEELALVSVQKRKGKKSKIDDRRCFKEEDIIISVDKLPVFKRGIINFIVGGITLRKLTSKNQHYAYVIHTATQKTSHISLKEIAETFLRFIRNRTEKTKPFIEKLLVNSYRDIKESILAYNLDMPKLNYIQEKFYEVIDREYYSIDVVNCDKAVDILLNDETGELNLNTPFSIFVGGQILDRGVTISNMIGFYYGRNPKVMQQDTVLQHSRMFGYRKELLPVTRFYTSKSIHSSMEKITEIDIALREDIKSGKQGEGVYFITNSNKDVNNGVRKIKPCSPDKIKISDIIFLRSYKRVLPVGFTPVGKVDFSKINKKISAFLREYGVEYKRNGQFRVELSVAEKLVKLIYSTIRKDNNTERFIEFDEFITTLRYMTKKDCKINIFVKWDRNASKFNKDGVTLQDAPDTGSSDGKQARKVAIDSPAIILTQQNGDSEGWKNRAFWWPILIAPKNVSKTIYASKVSGEAVKKKYN